MADQLCWLFCIAVLTALLNEIATIPGDFIIVLDDYHLIDAKSIDDGLTFLVERLPPQWYIALADEMRKPIAKNDLGDGIIEKVAKIPVE